MDLQVDCYAGYRGEETPRRIRLGGGTIDIKEIIDRWLAPDHRYFKVRGSDDGIYILRHDIESWRWDLVFYSGDVSGALPFPKSWANASEKPI